MKRGTSKVSRLKASSARSLSREPVELSAVREEIKNLVGNAAAEMVRNGIAEANEGHYAAMKFLFELVGLYPANDGGAEGDDGDGLAKALWSRLGVGEAEVTNVSPAKSGSGSDAVE